MNAPTSRFSIRRVLVGVVVGLALIVLSAPLLVERFQRGARELMTAREISTALLQARREIERAEESGGVLDSSAASKVRAIREAANEARDCLSEVERAYQWYELFIFSLPTDCKSMLSIIRSEFPSDEIQIPAVAAPQATSRTTSSGSGSGSRRDPRTESQPSVKDTSSCKQWRIRQISFRVPSEKRPNADWDTAFFDTAPDPFVEVMIDGRTYTLDTEKDSFSFSKNPHITVDAGKDVMLTAYDRDMRDHDRIFASSFFLPKEKTKTTIQSDEFRVQLSCIAEG